MFKKRVIITTSGIGERLKHFTKNTNKSLVKLGDKYAICHIIDSYDIKETDFVITLGYYGNHVRDFLKAAYPDHTFIFIEIDNYMEKGSSLGYSLLCSRHYLQQPFIFHCCDTIIDNNPYNKMPLISNTNILYVYEDFENLNSSNNYTTISTAHDDTNNLIESIHKKGSDKYDFFYIGLSYIFNYAEFWNKLEELYNNNKFNSELSDVDVYCYMINECIFNYIKVDKWYDTGNLDSYYRAIKHFPCKYRVLDKDYESICFVKDRVIKFINDKTINEQRYLRAFILNPLIPKILDKKDNYIVMEKIEGNVLSDEKNANLIYDLLNWSKEFLWKNDCKKNICFRENCRNFYIKKTMERLNIFFEKSGNNIEYNNINGLIIQPVKDILKLIDDEKILETDTFYPFHGDFILENIIKTEQINKEKDHFTKPQRIDKYKLVDWRNEFDKYQTELGDIHYDLSKLRHSMIMNHDSILNDIYDFKITEQNNVYVDIKTSYIFNMQQTMFEKFVIENGFSMTKIKIITAIIWLNMSALYTGKLSQFLFYFGKYNLFLSIY